MYIICYVIYSARTGSTTLRKATQVASWISPHGKINMGPLDQIPSESRVAQKELIAPSHSFTTMTLTYCDYNWNWTSDWMCMSVDILPVTVQWHLWIFSMQLRMQTAPFGQWTKSLWRTTLGPCWKESVSCVTCCDMLWNGVTVETGEIAILILTHAHGSSSSSLNLARPFNC